MKRSRRNLWLHDVLVLSRELKQIWQPNIIAAIETLFADPINYD